MNLSGAQFQGLADDINEHGGFSVIPKGRFAGLPPKNKFMVGQRDVEEGKHPAPAQGAEIERYATTHEAALDKPDRYLGGWEHGGTAYLDVPRGFSRTAAGEVAARRSSLTNDQISYGVMGPKRTFEGTVANPFHAEHTDPFNLATKADPDEATGAYFAGDKRLWTKQPLLSRQLQGR